MSDKQMWRAVAEKLDADEDTSVGYALPMTKQGYRLYDEFSRTDGEYRNPYDRHETDVLFALLLAEAAQ